MGVIRSLEALADGVQHAFAILDFFKQKQVRGACMPTALTVLASEPFVTKDDAQQLINALVSGDEKRQGKLQIELLQKSGLWIGSGGDFGLPKETPVDAPQTLIAKAIDAGYLPPQAADLEPRGLIVMDTRKDAQGQTVKHAYAVVNSNMLSLSKKVKKQTPYLAFDTANPEGDDGEQHFWQLLHNKDEVKKYLADHGETGPEHIFLALSPPKKK